MEEKLSLSFHVIAIEIITNNGSTIARIQDAASLLAPQAEELAHAIGSYCVE